jgi:hypothetical protein
VLNSFWRTFGWSLRRGSYAQGFHTYSLRMDAGLAVSPCLVHFAVLCRFSTYFLAIAYQCSLTHRLIHITPLTPLSQPNIRRHTSLFHARSPLRQTILHSRPILPNDPEQVLDRQNPWLNRPNPFNRRMCSTTLPHSPPLLSSPLCSDALD